LISGLFINEFMAKNDSAFGDEKNEYDDWIEIYNSNNYSVDLGGLYITKGKDDIIPFMIPLYDNNSTTIEPNGFKLLWADKDTEQGILHLDFNISASGGNIGLGQIINNLIVFIDSLEYGEQEADKAFGRYPDGNTDFADLFLTPGFSNILAVIDNPYIENKDYIIYPNPATDLIFIESNSLIRSQIGEIRNLCGQTVLSFEINSGFVKQINISGFAPGIYFIFIKGGNFYSDKIMVY